MPEHMQEVAGFLLFFVVAAIVTKLSIAMGSMLKPKKRKSRYDVGSVIKPKPELVSHYDAADINEIVRRVHAEKVAK